MDHIHRWNQHLTQKSELSFHRWFDFEFDSDFGSSYSAVPAAHYYFLLAAILFVALLPQCYFGFGLFHSAVPAAHYYFLLAAILFVALLPQSYFGFGLFHSAVPADLHFHYCHQHIFL